MFEYCFRSLPTGSTRERTGKLMHYATDSISELRSDADIMIIPCSVVLSENPKSNCHFIIEPSSYGPDFARLQLKVDPKNIYTSMCNANVDFTKQYLSTMLVRQKMAHVLQQKWHTIAMNRFPTGQYINVNLQGPSLKISVLDSAYSLPSQILSCCKMFFGCICFPIIWPILIVKCCCPRITKENERVRFECDFTFGLRMQKWPSIATEWQTRDRYWPLPAVEHKICEDGCHFVPKRTEESRNLYGGENEDFSFHHVGEGIESGSGLDWRISFSLAEVTLSHSYPEQARIVYCAFKAAFKKHIKPNTVVKIPTYFLKTMFMSLLEVTPLAFWYENQPLQHQWPLKVLTIPKYTATAKSKRPPRTPARLSPDLMPIMHDESTSEAGHESPENNPDGIGSQLEVAVNEVQEPYPQEARNKENEEDAHFTVQTTSNAEVGMSIAGDAIGRLNRIIKISEENSRRIMEKGYGNNVDARSFIYLASYVQACFNQGRIIHYWIEKNLIDENSTFNNKQVADRIQEMIESPGRYLTSQLLETQYNSCCCQLNLDVY